VHPTIPPTHDRPDLQTPGSNTLRTTTEAELFDPAHLHAQTIARNLFDAGLPDLAFKLENCGTQTITLTCRNCGKTFETTNRCNWRFCPHCGPRIARIRADTVRVWAAALKQPKHVVLTARNTEHLTHDYVRRFSKNLAKLRRHRWPHPWLAGTWTLELTNESRGWHLHAHLLIETRFIPPDLLGSRWARLITQDWAIFKIRDARAKDYAAEVAKYVAKPAQVASWPPEELRQVIIAFEGIRVFGVFGRLFKQRADFYRQVREARKARSRCECGANNWSVSQPGRTESPW
jgi:hypothetical protein